MKVNTTPWSLLTYKQEKVGRDKGIPFLSLLSSQHIPRRSIIHFDQYDERFVVCFGECVRCLFEAGYTY